MACMVTVTAIKCQGTLIKFDHLGTDEGLASGTVNSVLRDSKGYVWIGTIDGLNRYNGFEITTFKHDLKDRGSIVGNTVYAVKEDKEGLIWIATDQGLSVFDWEKEEFKTYINDPQNEKSLSNNHLRDVFVDSQGRVLLASKGGGVSVYEREADEFMNFTTSSASTKAISSDLTFSIIEDKPDFYWIGLNGGGLEYFDLKSGTFSSIIYDPNFPDIITDRKPLLKDSDGDIWIGTDGWGVYKWDVSEQVFSSFKHLPGVDGLSKNIITSFHEDWLGRIWIGTDGSGVDIYEVSTAKFTHLKSEFYDNNSLSSEAIRRIYEDVAGTIWVSTFRGGVNIYSPFRYKFNAFKHIPNNNNSLSFNSVIAIGETSDGYLWFGTDGGGLDQYDPATGDFRHYTSDLENRNSLSGNVIKSITEDKEGNLWLGTYSAGVTRYDRSRNRFYRYAPEPGNLTSLNDNHVWCMMEDKNGDFWLGTLSGGLAKYNREEDDFKHYRRNDTEPHAVASDYIRVLFEDDKGRFWVGTGDEGLDLFDPNSETFKHYPYLPDQSNGIPDGDIRAIFNRSNGELWIGTTNGIATYNENSDVFELHEINDRLSNKVIAGLLEDDNGKIWISTSGGLVQYNPVNDEIRVYDKQDGLVGNEFNYTSSVKAKSGKLYFGNLDGVNSFYPGQLEPNKFNPEVVLTDFKLFDQSISTGIELNGRVLFERSLEVAEKITLYHNENSFSLEFASLDYTAPTRNKYSHRLESFDSGWNDSQGQSRDATYTNMDPGVYTFVVRGSNSDGIWSSNDRSLTIEILPPWWGTWWFRIIVLLLTFSIVTVAIRWRIKTVKNQKEELEQKVNEATSKMALQNEQLQKQQENLQAAIEETNFIINEAVESGNYSARIEVEDKKGEWKELGLSINHLFESIMSPFGSITDIVNSMAENNLSRRYESEARGDVKLLTDSLNKALNNMSLLLLEIVRQVEYIGQSSQEMTITSEEMNTSTAEIATSIEEMTKGAQDQVQRIDESSGLLEAILTFSNNMSEQAEAINQAANLGVQRSDAGKVLIEKVESNMQSVAKSSKASNEAVNVLAERSGKISSILNVIKDIAGQTNLLSLNASIEAAKAGESGRGFAVVANEIRGLASKSNTSAKEIEIMIEEVQSAIGKTNDLISSMSGDINEGVQVAKEASEAFADLAVSYSQTLNLSEQIVEATNQQTNDVSNVVGAMEGVAVISEQTAAGTEEVAASSSELSAGMSQYTAKTKEVSDIAESLTSKVRLFKLTDLSDEDNLSETDDAKG